jgi:hypothetical protein
MYNTISDTVLNLAMTDNTQTASALWTAIGGVFRANKAPRSIFLNHEFHTLNQGDLSIDVYCVRMKEKADELHDVGYLSPSSSSTSCADSMRSTPASPITSLNRSPSPSPLRTISSSSKSYGYKTTKRRVLPPPSWLLPPLNSSSKVAGSLTPKRAPLLGATSPWFFY